jgi:type IV pilus assembly protein PilM
MAKGIGLDIGEFEVVVVELDGSWKKARLRKISIERVDAEDEAAPTAQKEATSALHALRDAHIGRENVVISVPAREAVLRTLQVPFKGTDNIRKVIKFETEGSIHSHSVDEMVVDFHVLEEGESETKVLVVAVPKAKLKPTLDALEAVGLEPETADLDAMALLRVAEWSGALAGPLPEAPAADGGELPVKADAAPAARVVVDVGARSTRILVTVAGELIDMRALRTGADAVAEDVAARSGGSLRAAREAVLHGFEAEEDFVLVEDAPEPAARTEGEGEDVPAAPAAPAAVPIPFATVRAARDAFLDRFRRELLRFVAAVPQLERVETVWYTGGGSRMPGVVAALEEVFGCPARPLDVLANLSHDLDETQRAQLGPRMAVAVGLALRPMGGVTGFNFRQEQLAFTKRFDRVKFPLSIACMLLLFLTVVFFVKTKKELDKLYIEFGLTADQPADPKRRGAKPRPKFYGYVGHFLNDGWFTNENNFPAERYEKLARDVEKAPVFGRLAMIKSDIVRYHTELQEKSGVFTGTKMRLGSGLGALCAASEVIQNTEARLGRFLLTELELKILPPAESRYLVFTVALRGEDYTSKYVALQNAFKEAMRDPDSPFLEVGAGTKRETPFPPGGEPGAYYELRLKLRPEESYPVFRPKS